MLRAGSSRLGALSYKLLEHQNLVSEFGKELGRRSEVFGIWQAGARTTAAPVSKSSTDYIEPGL